MTIISCDPEEKVLWQIKVSLVIETFKPQVSFLKIYTLPLHGISFKYYMIYIQPVGLSGKKATKAWS